MKLSQTRKKRIKSKRERSQAKLALRQLEAIVTVLVKKDEYGGEWEIYIFPDGNVHEYWVGFSDHHQSNWTCKDIEREIISLMSEGYEEES